MGGNMIVRSVYAGKEYTWRQGYSSSLLIDRKDAEASEVLLTTIAPENFTHRHIHKENEQLYFVVRGEGIIISRSEGETVDNEERIKSGDVVFIPANTEHQVFSKGEEPLIYLTIDVFPRGKPKDEPTWEAHAKIVAVEIMNR
jgi:mannose-6-phosphate isomerase-like protein (cupin superfamily)